MERNLWWRILMEAFVSAIFERVDESHTALHHHPRNQTHCACITPNHVQFWHDKILKLDLMARQWHARSWVTVWNEQAAWSAGASSKVYQAFVKDVSVIGVSLGSRIYIWSSTLGLVNTVWVLESPALLFWSQFALHALVLIARAEELEYRELIVRSSDSPMCTNGVKSWASSSLEYHFLLCQWGPSVCWFAVVRVFTTDSSTRFSGGFRLNSQYFWASKDVEMRNVGCWRCLWGHLLYLSQKTLAAPV